MITMAVSSHRVLLCTGHAGSALLRFRNLMSHEH